MFRRQPQFYKKKVKLKVRADGATAPESLQGMRWVLKGVKSSVARFRRSATQGEELSGKRLGEKRPRSLTKSWVSYPRDVAYHVPHSRTEGGAFLCSFKTLGGTKGRVLILTSERQLSARHQTEGGGVGALSLARRHERLQILD